MNVTMVGKQVIRQDGGWVAVAVLSDMTFSTPQGAPVRISEKLAEQDLPAVRWIGPGPVYAALHDTRQVQVGAGYLLTVGRCFKCGRWCGYGNKTGVRCRYDGTQYNRDGVMVDKRD